MRSIYKYQVISAILINLFTLLLIIYMFNYNSFILISIPIIGAFYGNILKNGGGLTNKKRAFIIVSLIVTLAVFLFYIYNMLINKYI